MSSKSQFPPSRDKSDHDKSLVSWDESLLKDEKGKMRIINKSSNANPI